jgi:heme exporter protein CcmD
MPARRGGEAVSGATATWLAMGGYAVFVWPAYGVATAVLGGLAWHFWRRHRRSETALLRLQQQSDRAA